MTSNFVTLCRLMILLPGIMVTGSLARARAGTNDFLLKTRWYQDGPFAQFTPDQQRLGCWSIAYAQILYHHRLKPVGRVQYECANGRLVDVDLDQYRFDWAQFPDSITQATPRTAAEQVARYSFATAVVVRKDFGTSGYKRLLNSVTDLETHFPVEARIHVHLGDKLPLGRAELEVKLRAERVDHLIDRQGIINLLTREVAEGRPVYFHFGNIKDFGHSTVIDGLRRDGDRSLAHINYGAVEPEATRWYDLFAPISQPDDVTLRAFVTIKPRSLLERRAIPEGVSRP